MKLFIFSVAVGSVVLSYLTHPNGLTPSAAPVPVVFAYIMGAMVGYCLRRFTG